MALMELVLNHKYLKIRFDYRIIGIKGLWKKNLLWDLLIWNQAFI